MSFRPPTLPTSFTLPQHCRNTLVTLSSHYCHTLCSISPRLRMDFVQQWRTVKQKSLWWEHSALNAETRRAHPTGNTIFNGICHHDKIKKNLKYRHVLSNSAQPHGSSRTAAATAARARVTAAAAAAVSPSPLLVAFGYPLRDIGFNRGSFGGALLLGGFDGYRPSKLFLKHLGGSFRTASHGLLDGRDDRFDPNEV